jgi:hypothetical protein
MRTALRGISQPKLTFSVAFLAVLALVPAQSTTAAQLKEAQITQIVKEVNLLPGQAASRTAVINDNVRDGTAVRTGEDSRTELTFSDQTLARLGANTLFSFNEGTRKLDLGGGAMLLRVPKGAGGATVRTAAVTAAITGTTLLLEYHPKAYIKLIGLEGTVRMYLKGRLGESVLIRPGQMLIVKPDAKRLPDPVDVDLDRLMKTCVLITDFPPLGSTPLIADEIKRQHDQKVDGDLIDTNLVIVGRGTLVTLIDPTSLDTIDQKTNAVRTKTGFQPIKFGPLPTIVTPSPYVINSGTIIQTDPMITTNGQTDFGKIYRSQADDGQPADYFFGSASPFDGTISFNSLAENPANLPIAAFKFTSLQLTGNPTISLGTGGATSLVLISEGAITSGAPGGTLTFPNMDLVLLATQNGAINLGNTISFANMPQLRLYARGAGSNLTLASPMAGMGSVGLTAEGSVQVNGNEGVQFFNSFAGVDFLAGSGLITASGGISIGALNAVNFSMKLFSIASGAGVFLGSNQTGTVNIDASSNPALFSNAGTVEVLAANLNITGGTTMTFGNLTNASFTTLTGTISAGTMRFFHPGGLLEMSSAGDLNAQSILGGDLISANGGINVTGDLSSHIASAGGSIAVGGNLTNTQLTQVGGALNVTGTLNSEEVEMTTGANISAAKVSVLLLNKNFVSSNTTLTAGTGGITPYLPPGPTLHNWLVNTIESHSAPTGIDFSGNNFGPGQDAASLVLVANTQTFSQANGIHLANFNGGDSAGLGNPAGSGGTLDIRTTGILSIAPTEVITATTGIIDPNDNPSGAGGTVSLTAGGELDITGATIQVSSADAVGSANRRSSARGGNINVTGHAATGIAIQINNTSQLLSLLASAASPGGSIAVAADGASSSVAVNGKLEADGAGGSIDVRHTGTNGTVSITGGVLLAEIVKVAALGQNGVLTIGTNSVLNANDVLKLYAEGSNGQIVFAGNCSIRGGNLNIIAAPTVTVNSGVSVNVTGATAQIFTNTGNYSVVNGGNGNTTGVFAGSGATTDPSGFAGRPALGPPGGP